MFLSSARRRRGKASGKVVGRRRKAHPPSPPRVEELEDRLVPSGPDSGVSIVAPPAPGDPGLLGLRQNIDHIIVIYQENWSFDALYGNFPGANGLANAPAAGTIPQVDRFGNPLTSLPNPSTNPPVPGGLPVQPYDLSQYVAPDQKTSDIIHRFYHEQLQIDNGALEPSTGHMDQFVTWSDNGTLVMSYFDATNLPEGQLAQQYTLDDNFFHAAYGGSFLNHQFLVAAAAPPWEQPIPAGFRSSWDPVTRTLTDSNLTLDGKYVVNTTFAAQAPHPSNVTPDKLLAPINDNDPSRPDYTPTIGDRLDAAGVSWKWYSGGWDDALAGHADPLFQFHHQPFAYYANYAPFNPDGTLNPDHTGPDAHLQDENNFFADLASGDLPAVSFIKPLGPDNEHPGYASLLAGQQHVADIVHAVQNSPEWAHTAIVITYDENGGRWDHVTPPSAYDGWGDGTRVPAIVISPFAKKEYVDHTQHDTLSILKLIEQRFDLAPLNGRDARASSLVNDFSFPAPGKDQHVLILSVDGLHQADVADPQLRASLANVRALEQAGITYTNAYAPAPSDSFPGTLAYLTGAHPGTTGVFYDDSYDRTLFAPGTAHPQSATPGTEVLFDESIDKDPTVLSGGGNFDASSIDLGALPVDSAGNPVYPHDYLKVDTLFNVAENAGLYTAFSDKHPGGYDIANGPEGPAIDDIYSPEIAANVALLSKATGHTVNADQLPADTDLGGYTLVDSTNDPDGPNDPNLEAVTHNVLLTEAYDDLKVRAVLNEISGLNSRGTRPAPVPNLFAMNFQAVSVAEKSASGGIDLVGGQEVPSAGLRSALAHTDASIGAIVNALRAHGLFDDTLLVVTAKHGQTPRVGVGGLVKDDLFTSALAGGGVAVAQATQDDVALLWLQDEGQTGAAVAALRALRQAGSVDVYYQGVKKTVPASQVIDRVLSGPALQAYSLGTPGPDSRTPDVVVTLRPGFILVGNPLKFQFKRAEHGGLSEDDRHVPLILAGGVPAGLRGSVQAGRVETTQVAVTALEALGLDPGQLQGAAAEHTLGLTVDESGRVAVHTSGLAYHPGDGLYHAHLTADHVSQLPAGGTLLIRLADLPPGVLVDGASVKLGNTVYLLAVRTDPDGNPVLVVPPDLVGRLGPGQPLEVDLAFRNPARQPIAFDVQTLLDPFLTDVSSRS
jgi:phospholipase C/arylsulfatase A-like enzyme